MTKFKILSKIKPESLTSEFEIKHKEIFFKNENLFEFDEVFHANSDNKKIFESLKSTVDDVFLGCSANIIAFGMPGTGKSHTLFGTKSDGLLNYIINYIYDELRKQTPKDVVIKISYFDIINGRIKDLLGSSNSPVTVTFDPACQKSKYVNLKQHICLSKSSFEFYKKSGDDKRPQKYKGHTIFRIIIELIESNFIDSLKRSTISNLDLIELNYADSGPFVKFIFKTQSNDECFENCISAVLYKSFLGLGNTVLICNIALSNIKETKQILKLASSCAKKFDGNPIVERFVCHDENYFLRINTELNELIKLCKCEDNRNNLPLTKLSSVEKQEFLKYYHTIEIHLGELREFFCKNNILSQIIDDISNEFRNILCIMEPENVSIDKNNSFCRNVFLENKLSTLENNLQILKMRCVPSYLQVNNTEDFKIKPDSPAIDKRNLFDYFVHNNSNLNESILSLQNKENQSPMGSCILNISTFSPLKKAALPDMSITTVAKVNSRQVTRPEFDTKSYIVNRSTDKTDNSQWKSYVTERVLVKSQSVQTD